VTATIEASHIFIFVLFVGSVLFKTINNVCGKIKIKVFKNACFFLFFLLTYI